MALLHYLWSRVANSNSNSDAQVNWAENQAPSSVNDSARAMMASLAGYRDDIAGAIVTGGTSTAYTVASYQVFDTLAHMGGQIIAFTPHTTNGATVTLNVDGLGAKPLRSSTGVEILASTLIAGTPYLALYNNSDAAFYLHGFYGNPYNVPLASGMDYWAATAPNSAFVFPIGQAISRTTYSSLFALIGTTYGVGDGSTTFNVPDKGERVSIMKVSAASRMTSTYFGGNSTVLGSTGGLESQTLTLAQIPTGIISAQNGIALSVNSQVNVVYGLAAVQSVPSSGGAVGFASTPSFGVINSIGAINVSTVSNNTGGGAHPIVQPSIVCNYIMRVL